MSQLIHSVKKFFSVLKKLHVSTIVAYSKPIYRVIEITKNKESNYIATLQIIGTNSVFHESPEKILAKDDIVDKMLPRDVRALTYLGYLEMNSPKYTLLAKKLSAGNDKTLFALQKNEDGSIAVKDAEEISKDKEIINSLSQEDAHMIGYTNATEQINIEQKFIEKHLKDKR